MAGNELSAVADEARALFREKDYAEALELFAKCARTDDGDRKQQDALEFQVTMLNNCAQCCLCLEQFPETRDYAQRCVTLDPCNAKAHYRLAAALANDVEANKAGHDEKAAPHEAFEHICVAAGLAGGGDRAIQDLFAKLRGEMAEAMAGGADGGEDVTDDLDPMLRTTVLPASTQDIAVVATSQQLQAAVSRCRLVIMKPGVYGQMCVNLRSEVMMKNLRSEVMKNPDLHMMMLSQDGLSTLKQLWLYGLGQVVVRREQGHVVNVDHSADQVARVQNLTVEDPPGPRPEGAPFLVGGGGKLAVIGCAVRQVRECGVLCCENAFCLVQDCSFEGLSQQAVEIREGASGTVVRCEMKRCRQGVSCYGGARNVYLREVVVDSSENEGFFFDGEKRNAATRAQEYDPNDRADPTTRMIAEMQYFRHPDTKNNPNERVSLACSEQARKDGGAGLLAVVLEGCVVRNAGNFGATCDHGSQVTMRNCLFEKNHHIGVYVKGETDADLGSMVFAQNGAAVQIDINYGGNVVVYESVFWKNKNDVKESTLPADAKMKGLWSKPAVIKKKLVAENKNEIPTARQLANRSRNALPLRPVSRTRTETEGERLARLCGAACCPARMSLRDAQLEYYAIGNTRGFDLLASSDAPGALDGDVRVLLAACGDVRNAVETVVGWWRRGAGNGEAKLKITMNDRCCSMLVRDGLLLELLRVSSAATVAEVWGSLSLKPKANDDLARAMAQWLALLRGETAQKTHEVRSAARLADADAAAQNTDGDHSRKANTPFGFVAQETMSPQQQAHMAEVLTSWTNCSLTLQAAQKTRAAQMDADNGMFLSSLGLSLGAVGSEKVADRKTVSAYLRNTCLSNKGTKLNATMLEAPYLEVEQLYFSSSIYRATGTVDVVAFLQDRIIALREAFNSGRVEIAFACCDVFALPVPTAESDDGGNAAGTDTEGSMAPSLPFNVADFANVADYVGLSNVLGFASRLVRRGGRIFAQQMRWSQAGVPASSFVVTALGVKSLDTFAQLSGLRLVKQSEPCDVIHTEWTNLDAQETETKTTCMLNENIFLHVAAFYCRLLPPPDPYGTHHASPATLALFRNRKWVKTFGAALVKKFPLYANTFSLDLGFGKGGPAAGTWPWLVLHWQGEIDSMRARCTSGVIGEFVMAVLVLDTARLRQERPALHKALAPEVKDQQGRQTRTGQVLLIEGDCCGIAAVLHQAACDFDAARTCFLADHGFPHRHREHAVVLARELPQGFEPLTALAPVAALRRQQLA